MESVTHYSEELDQGTHNPPDVRRNLAMISIGVCFFWGLSAFFDMSTIVPAFLSTLTSSSLTIGVVAAVKPAGMLLPQLWVAHYVRNRTRHKKFLIKGYAICRLGIAAFAGVLFLSGPSDRALMLGAFLAMCTVFWTTDGFVSVPYLDFMAKAIPERTRGRMFGFSQVGGGVIAILVGLLASRIFSSRGPSYPTNYAVFFAVAAVVSMPSLLSLFGVREPDGKPEEHDDGFIEYVRNIGEVLSSHGHLKLLISVQVLMRCFDMSLPFFILYAKEMVGISGTGVGLLLSAQNAGAISCGALVGYLNDRRGPKMAILATLSVGVTSTVLALLLGQCPLWIYGIIFFAIGGTTGTMYIGATNFLLELAEPHERRPYFAVINTATAPCLFFPILGGLIAQTASYEAVFVTTGVAYLAAIVLTLKLKSGRNR